MVELHFCNVTVSEIRTLKFGAEDYKLALKIDKRLNNVLCKKMPKMSKKKKKKGEMYSLKS